MYTYTYMYIFQKKHVMFIILNIFIYNINTVNINKTCKYFQNIYCMCVYLHIYILNTQTHEHIYANKNFYFACD